MATIVIADEQPLIRYAVRQFLEARGYQVLVELDNGTDALRKTRDLAPDLLIIDMALPGLSGLEIIRRLRQQANPVPVLVLTAQSSEHFAGLCLQAGGTGFIGKLDELAELDEAVRTLLRGHSYFPSHALGNVAPQIGLKAEEDQLKSLSTRELDVLRHLAHGRGNKDIATQLALSESTVSTYKTRLQQKLNVNSLAQLLEIAWRHGLLAVMAAESKVDPIPASGLQDAQFHQLFDAMPIPVALRDREGRLQACNRLHLEFHGITEEQAFGIRLCDSPVLEPEQALRLHQEYLQAVDLDQPYSLEHILRYQEHRKVIRSWGVPVRDKAGILTGMICSNVDISEQDQHISALTQAREQGRSVRRTRAEFLHEAGEKLSALLQASMASVRTLGTQLPDSPILLLAQTDLRALHEHLQILLDLIRIERGSLVLLPSAADLILLTTQAVAGLNRRQSGAENVSLHIRPSSVHGWVDTRRYRQMLEAACEYAFYLGLADIALHCQVTELSHADFLWHVSITPGPRSLATDWVRDLSHNEINPQLVISSHLAMLMDGELTLEPPVAGMPLLRLVMRLAHAIDPSTAKTPPPDI
jgi:two-component system sensor histidine kinase EvgS/two-component system response regulator EvgA